MGVSPSVCAVIEDSANGIRSGLAAGMTVIAIPNPHFAPPPELLRSAAAVLSTIDDLTPEVLT
jgi:beta-phosphoglucomutase-like phosphatase (HAD superfamily)